MQFSRIHVIINPASGRDEPILNILNRVFSDCQYDVSWDVAITRSWGDGAMHARLAIENGADLIAAYGGDGTVLDVAEGMLDYDIPLAILPGGTANVLAGELGVPGNLADAMRLPLQLKSGGFAIRAIDVGQAARRYFLLRAGTGLVGTLSAKVSRTLKDHLGIAAYIIRGIQALSNPQFVTYTLTIDETTYHTSGTACLVTNASAIGALNMRLSPKIRIDDGLLDVYVVNNDVESILGLAGSIANLERLPVKLQHWQGRSIKIDTYPSLEVFGDGESTAFTRTPCEMTLLPSALRVIVPTSS